jgi:DNA-binding response OmpR family regulator
MTNCAKILVAEDSKVTREMLRMLLAREGYNVVFAEDGEQAVELALTEKPDLVLSDGLLPKMHGFLACKAIKSVPMPPKVVLLTGVYTKPNYKWEAKLDFGADDLLVKPFKPEELLACIRKHLNEATASSVGAPSGFERKEDSMPVEAAIISDAEIFPAFGVSADI